MGEKRLIVDVLRDCKEFDADLLKIAADRIEDLQETVDVFIFAQDLLRKRKGYKRYLEYWRKKNGKSDLCYPDGDQVYKDFWEMKERCEDLEMIVAGMKTEISCLEARNDELVTKMSYMIDPNAIGDRNGEMGW